MPTLVIHHTTVIDGTGRPPIPHAAVRIEGQEIRSVGPESQVTRELPPDATVIDAQGGYVLPGFVDAHVHLAAQFSDMELAMRMPPVYTLIKNLSLMERTLKAGVTTVRDAGGLDRGTKMAVDQGLIAGPRMQLAINMLSMTGGHGDHFWEGIGARVGLFGGRVPDAVCDGPDEVRRTVRKMLRAGAEVIKVATSGGVLSPLDDPRHTQFSPEELRVVVEEAWAHGGMRAMAHAQGADGIKNAVRAGFVSIEHGIYLDDEAIDLMLEHGTFLVPTLLAPLSILEGVRSGRVQMPEYAVRKSEAVLDIHRENIARAWAAGVRIAMGTDSGVGPHGANLRELALLCQIGMTPMEAIEASTRIAAECLGWHDHIGTVEPGKLADLVISRKNPLEDITCLQDPENLMMVLKGGRVVQEGLA